MCWGVLGSSCECHGAQVLDYLEVTASPSETATARRQGASVLGQRCMQSHAAGMFGWRGQHSAAVEARVAALRWLTADRAANDIIRSGQPARGEACTKQSRRLRWGAGVLGFQGVGVMQGKGAEGANGQWYWRAGALGSDVDAAGQCRGGVLGCWVLGLGTVCQGARCRVAGVSGCWEVLVGQFLMGSSCWAQA